MQFPSNFHHFGAEYFEDFVVCDSYVSTQIIEANSSMTLNGTFIFLLVLQFKLQTKFCSNRFRHAANSIANCIHTTHFNKHPVRQERQELHMNEVNEIWMTKFSNYTFFIVFQK